MVDIYLEKNSEGSFNAEDIGLNNDGAVEAAQYIEQFYKSGVFPKGIIGEQCISTLDSLFTEGNGSSSNIWTLEYRSI